VTELDPEDGKLVTVARAIRARVGAPEGAAVRDVDGRTYAAATVELPSLSLSALEAAVAAAVSSGAAGLEAAAVSAVTDGEPAGLAAVRDLGGVGVPVFITGPDGTVRRTLRLPPPTSASGGFPPRPAAERWETLQSARIEGMEDEVRADVGA
jgi:hypothetical protein